MGPFSRALSEIFADATAILGVSIRWKDADDHLRSSMPRDLVEHQDAYCLSVKSSDPKRSLRCRNHCLLTAASWAAAKKPKQRSTCHAGCVEIRIPISVAGKIIGTLMLGPFRAKAEQTYLPEEPLKLPEISRLLQQLIPRLQRERDIELADFIQHALHPTLRLLSQVLVDYQHQQSAQDIANACAISVSRLQHLCKEQFSESLGVLCDRALLRRAQRALLSDQAIGRVAIDLGFEDQRYFATWFKRQTQQSPSQWRQQHEEVI